jgi:UDP-N-acetylglucosamine pyrophosphorylase
MIAKRNFENIKRLLKKHNQSHLLAFWEQLDAAQKQNLAAQIKQLDFSKIDDWVANYIKKPLSAAIPADFTPARAYNPNAVDPEQKRKYTEARELGKERRTGNPTGIRGPKGKFPHQPC